MVRLSKTKNFTLAVKQIMAYCVSKSYEIKCVIFTQNFIIKVDVCKADRNVSNIDTNH